MNNSHSNLSSPLHNILSKLKKVKYIGSNRHMAECPAHQDKEPSLSITTGDDGRILLKCFGGCPTEGIVKALGLQIKDLFPPKRGERGVLTTPKKPATVQRSDKSPRNTKEKEHCSEKDCCSVDITLPSAPPIGGGV